MSPLATLSAAELTISDPETFCGHYLKLQSNLPPRILLRGTDSHSKLLVIPSESHQALVHGL